MTKNYYSIKLKNRVQNFYRQDNRTLDQKTSQGFLNNIIFKISTNILEIISIAILARLISKEDFGYFAICSISMAIIYSVSTLGLSKATIQYKNLSFRQSSNVFWVNFYIGIILILLSVLVGYVNSTLYENKILFLITVLLGLKLFTQSCSSQYFVLLNRKHQFKEIGLIQVSSKFVSVVFTCILALIYHNIYVLVFGAIIESFISLALLFSVTKWYPVFPKKMNTIFSLLRFGGELSLSSIFMILSKNIDKLLIGIYVNPSATAVYQKSFNLTRKQVTEISDSLRSVGLATFSQITDDKKAFRSYYRNFTELIAYLTIPLIFVTAILSEEFVLMLLGDQWKECIPLITIFSIASIFESTSRLRSSVLISFKLSKIIIRLQLFRGIFELTAIIIGLYWGIMGIAVCYSFVILSYSIISLLYAIKKTPLSFSDYYIPLSKPLLTMVFITCIFYLLRLNEINTNNVLFNFIGKASFIFTLFLIISLLNKKLRKKLNNFYKQVKI
jgi:PST family polysaccharide transporter